MARDGKHRYIEPESVSSPQIPDPQITIPQNLGIFVSVEARDLYNQKFTKRSVGIERSVVTQHLTPYVLGPILASSGLEHFFSLGFKTNYALVRQFYANIHAMSTEPPSFSTSVNGNLLVITPTSIAELLGCSRPPVENQICYPFELSQEQYNELVQEALLDIVGSIFSFQENISCANLMPRARILHRIMLGTVFCKTESLSEISPEQAYYLWRALKGDLLDIPMMVWCQIYDAYSAPVKNSLPFGSLIIGLLPSVISPNLHWVECSTPFDKRAIAAMHISEEPRGPTFNEEMIERIFRLEEIGNAHSAQLKHLTEMAESNLATSMEILHACLNIVD